MKVIQLYKSERDLIKKAVRQHREAQQHLYKKYAPKMLAVCRRYIKDVHFAEDVMVTRIYERFHQIKSV